MSCTLQLLLAALVITANDFDRKSKTHKLLQKQKKKQQKKMYNKVSAAGGLHCESGPGTRIVLSRLNYAITVGECQRLCGVSRQTAT